MLNKMKLTTLGVGLVVLLAVSYCDEDSDGADKAYCLYEIVNADGSGTGRDICDEFTVADGQSKSDYETWCLAEDADANKGAGSFDDDCDVLPDYGDCEASWPDPVTGESVTRIVHYSTGHEASGNFPAEENCTTFLDGTYTSAE